MELYKETDPKKMKGGPPGGFKVKEESFSEYFKKVTELQDREINLGIKKISVSLDDLEPCSPNEIELLLPFIQLEEGEVIQLLTSETKEEDK